MFLPGNRLKKASGKIIKFKSAQARRNWERVALAYKHGWGGPKTHETIYVPITNWTVETAKKFLKDNKVKNQSVEPKSNEMFRSVVDKIRTALAEAEVSNKDWSAVDKSKLPAACFLWVEDPEKKSTWHLPYKEGAGDINPDTGMYSKAGPVNANAVRAIMSALGGAHTGKPMSVPDEVKTKAEDLAKKLKIGQYAKESQTVEGGPGSGNFGHAGRAGEVGGSSGDGGGGDSEKGLSASTQNSQEFLGRSYKAKEGEPRANQVAVQPADNEHPMGGFLVANGGGEPYTYIHNDQSLDQFAKSAGWDSGDHMVKELGVDKSDFIGQWTLIIHDRVNSPETGTKWGSKKDAKQYIESHVITKKESLHTLALRAIGELKNITDEELNEMFSTYQELGQMFEGMFMSLQNRMYDTVREKFGDKYCLNDWSEDTVLLRAVEKSSTPGGPISMGDSDIFYQVGYSIDDSGNIVFEGEPIKVRRVVNYVPVE